MEDKSGDFYLRALVPAGEDGPRLLLRLLWYPIGWLEEWIGVGIGN